MSGEFSAGLRTMEQPTASAGAIFQVSRVSGKFHGVTAPTTPAGSRSIMAHEESPTLGISSSTLSMASPNHLRVRWQARTSIALASRAGLPISRAVRTASWSAWSFTRCAHRIMTSLRSAGAMPDQRRSSKAARADATARSTSSAEAMATSVTT